MDVQRTPSQEDGQDERRRRRGLLAWFLMVIVSICMLFSCAQLAALPLMRTAQGADVHSEMQANYEPWNYVAFGVMHAIGVVWVHYYTNALKRRLGRDGFRAYNTNPWLHSLAVALTFAYVTASHFLFANSFADMQAILAAVRWS